MRTYIPYLLILVFSVQQVAAQQNSASNIDGSKYNFGFIIGYNSNSLRIEKKSTFRNPDSLQTVIPNNASGFNLGLLANLKLAKSLDLRFTPTLSFVDRDIQYTYIDSELDQLKRIESTYVDFPLSLKLKSIRLRNVRFFIIGGIKTSLDVISQKKFDDRDLDEEDKKVKLKRLSNAWEVGFGFDLYYPYFKVSPEIKIARGISNLLVKENNRFSRPLDGLFAEAFQLNFYFE